MYDRNYYAQVDDAMMKLWKDFGRRLLHVLDSGTEEEVADPCG